MYKKILLLSALITIGSINLTAREHRVATATEVSSEPQSIDSNSLPKKIAQGLVIVDFYADWCGPCKKFLPIFTKVSNEMSETLTFYKLNINDSFEAVDMHSIKTIPTIILFADGQEISRQSGSCTEKELRTFIDTALISHKK